MAVSLFKWLNISLMIFLLPCEMFQSNSVSEFPLQGARGRTHPYYISVVEINHNATDKTLEISCKIFTNDFEAILEKNYKTKVDLVNPKDKASTEKLVNDYVTKHLSFKADGKSLRLSYLGYEKQDEAIYSYFQVDSIA